MSNIKSYKISLGIFLIIVVVSIALIMMYQPSIPEKQFINESIKENTTNENVSQNQTEVIVKTSEEGEKWIHEAEKRENITYASSIQSTLESASLSSKPTFKVGEKYTYKIKTPASPFPPSHYANSNIIMEDYIYYNVTFTVDKKERINGSDYYVFITDGSGNVIVGYVYRNNKKPSTLSTTPILPFKWYVNTENGNKFNENMGKITDYYSSKSGMQLSKTYISWMLKLSEGLKWTIKQEEKSTGSAGCTYIGDELKCLVDKKYKEYINEQSYEVEDIEKINGRKCFKVNVREKSCTNGECKILKRMTYWVDVEKRITVKYQLWYEGLSVVEIELIDYQK